MEFEPAEVDLRSLLAVLEMPKKKDANGAGESFGQRLARLRIARGFTQVELGEAIGVSQRVITYYERETERPPAHLLHKIAQALRASTDELLGIQKMTEAQPPRNASLWRKLRKVEELPRKDQKHVLDTIDALLARRRLRGQHP